jgi:hypothetical protein
VAIDLNSYVDVATRLKKLRENHPNASLQPLDPANPYRVQTIGDQTFIVYVAACYRSPDDQRPGIGTAWEVFPGKTNYTRGSELQNAETSAWGRAIVAALAADTRRGVASQEDVRNRNAEQGDRRPRRAPSTPEEALIADIAKFGDQVGIPRETLADTFHAAYRKPIKNGSVAQLSEFLDKLHRDRDADVANASDQPGEAA